VFTALYKFKLGLMKYLRPQFYKYITYWLYLVIYMIKTTKFFTVIPCINNINCFIFQLMHSSIKILGY